MVEKVITTFGILVFGSVSMLGLWSMGFFSRTSFGWEGLLIPFILVVAGVVEVTFLDFARRRFGDKH